MVIDPQLFQLYLLAAVILIVMPGPDSLLVLSRSLFDGRRAGWITAAGTTLGNVLHAFLAAAGVSALIAASPGLFEAVRLAGAGYLAWLGVRSLQAAWLAWRQGQDQPLLALPRAGAGATLVNAFLTNILNPKVVLFYLAFVPQFVSPLAGPVPLQIFLLGLCLAGLAWVYHLLLAVLAASLARQIVNSRAFAVAINGMGGLLFLAFATRLFLSERRFA